MKRKIKITLALVVPTIVVILAGLIVTKAFSEYDLFKVWAAHCERAGISWEGVPGSHIFHENTYGQWAGLGSIECPWGGYAYPVFFAEAYYDPANGNARDYYMDFGTSMINKAPSGHKLSECSIFAAVHYYRFEFGQEVEYWRYIDRTVNYSCYVVRIPTIAKQYARGLKMMFGSSLKAYPPPPYP